MTTQKPSEKMTENSMDGKIIVDSKGRKMVLRQPNALDLFDLAVAMGENSTNIAANAMAANSLHIATIDGLVLQSPHSYSEVRANIQRVGLEGFEALNKFLNEHSETVTEKEAIDKLKKS